MWERIIVIRALDLSSSRYRTPPIVYRILPSQELVTRARGYGIPDCPEQSSANKELTTTLGETCRNLDTVISPNLSSLASLSIDRKIRFLPSCEGINLGPRYRIQSEWSRQDRSVLIPYPDGYRLDGSREASGSEQFVHWDREELGKRWPNYCSRRREGTVIIYTLIYWSKSQGDVKSFVRVVEAAGGYVKRIVVWTKIRDRSSKIMFRLDHLSLIR